MQSILAFLNLAMLLIAALCCQNARASLLIGADGSDPPALVTWHSNMKWNLTIEPGTKVLFRWRGSVATSLSSTPKFDYWYACENEPDATLPILGYKTSGTYTFDSTGKDSTTWYFLAGYPASPHMCNSGYKVMITVLGTTSSPVPYPTAKPSKSASPTTSRSPTLRPSTTARPTQKPAPTMTSNPTGYPTPYPVPAPTFKPTKQPKAPTSPPTKKPVTHKPSMSAPTIPRPQPTSFPSTYPTSFPTAGDVIPQDGSTSEPTVPTKAPSTLKPTKRPTAKPAAASTSRPVVSSSTSQPAASSQSTSSPSTADQAAASATPSVAPSSPLDLQGAQAAAGATSSSACSGTCVGLSVGFTLVFAGLVGTAAVAIVLYSRHRVGVGGGAGAMNVARPTSGLPQPATSPLKSDASKTASPL